MRDVAARCNVSISTVSLVLSGDPRIPEDTARRVIQAVKAMEYRPSVLARSLARRVSRAIGVILPEFAFEKNAAFYYQALRGIHAQTQPAGYKMVVEAANKVFLSRRYYLRILKEQSADGMIYMAATLNDSFLNELEKESYPFVLLGGCVEGVNLTCALGDDALGAKMATEHLIKLGHKAIGHVAGPSNVSYGRDREAGYRQAMQEAGLEVKPEWVIRTDFDMQQGEEATYSLLDKVTAIFAANDSLAFAVIRALQARRRRIPDDMAVVGMDDLELAAWVTPPLTTVRYDIQMMAEIATKHVISRAQNPTLSKQAVEGMPAPQLIVRASCGAAR